jgi:hypothetical protein
MLRHNSTTETLRFVTSFVFRRLQSFVKEKVYLNDLVHSSLDNSKHGDKCVVIWRLRRAAVVYSEYVRT